MDTQHLIPIQLELEVNGERISDSFLWNIYEKDITPMQFAEGLCRDLNAPIFYARQIVEQIQDRIAAAKATRSTRKSQDNVHEAAIKNVLKDEYRSILQIGALVGRYAYSDQIEWDAANPKNSPEEFATQLVREMGLHNEYIPLISHSIREQLENIRTQCINVGVRVAQTKAEADTAGQERYLSRSSSFYNERNVDGKFRRVVAANNLIKSKPRVSVTENKGSVPSSAVVQTTALIGPQKRRGRPRKYPRDHDNPAAKPVEMKSETASESKVQNEQDNDDIVSKEEEKKETEEVEEVEQSVAQLLNQTTESLVPLLNSDNVSKDEEEQEEEEEDGDGEKNMDMKGEQSVADILKQSVDDVDDDDEMEESEESGKEDTAYIPIKDEDGVRRSSRKRVPVLPPPEPSSSEESESEPQMEANFMPKSDFESGRFEFVLKSKEGTAVRLFTEAPPKMRSNPITLEYEVITSDEGDYGLDVWFRSAGHYLHKENSIQFAHGLLLLKIQDSIDKVSLRDDRKRYCREFRKVEEKVRAGQTTWLPYHVEILSMKASSQISRLLASIPACQIPLSAQRSRDDELDDLEVGKRITRSDTAATRYESFLLGSKTEEMPECLPDLSKNMRSVFRTESAEEFGPALEKLTDEDVRQIDVKLDRLRRARRRGGGGASGAMQMRTQPGVLPPLNNGLCTGWLNVPDSVPIALPNEGKREMDRRWEMDVSRAATEPALKKTRTRVIEEEVPDSWTCVQCGCPWWATRTLRRNADGVKCLCNACGLKPDRIRTNVTPYWIGKTIMDFPPSYRTKSG